MDLLCGNMMPSIFLTFVSAFTFFYKVKIHGLLCAGQNAFHSKPFFPIVILRVKLFFLAHVAWNLFRQWGYLHLIVEPMFKLHTQHNCLPPVLLTLSCSSKIAILQPPIGSIFFGSTKYDFSDHNAHSTWDQLPSSVGFNAPIRVGHSTQVRKWGGKLCKHAAQSQSPSGIFCTP